MTNARVLHRLNLSSRMPGLWKDQDEHDLGLEDVTLGLLQKPLAEGLAKLLGNVQTGAEAEFLQLLEV